MANQPYSPLDEVFETEHFPHARTLRTSFSQKIWDTYNAFAGTSPLIVGEPHVGIFDYATLFIPLALYMLMLQSFQQYDKSLRGLILPIILVLINILFIITRMVCALIATFIAIPITAIVHVFSWFIAKNARQQALSATGLLSNGENTTLDSYLKTNHLNIEQVKVEVVWDQRLCASPIPDTYHLEFRPKQSNIESTLWGEKIQAGRAPFSIEVNMSKPSTNIHALFTLNVGQTTTFIERKLESDATDRNYQHLKQLLTI